MGRIPLILKPGIPICQLIIEAVVGEPAEHESQFNTQTTPVGGK